MGQLMDEGVTSSNRYVAIACGLLMAALYLTVGRQSATEQLPALDLSERELGDILVLGITVLAQFVISVVTKIWRVRGGPNGDWGTAQSELISLATGAFGSIVTVWVLFEVLAFESTLREFAWTLFVALAPFGVFLIVAWYLLHRTKRVTAAAGVVFILLCVAAPLLPLLN
jgi:hypothetical protein